MNKMGLAEYKGVFVFAQQVDNVLDGVAFELLGKGKELAKDLNTEVTAVLIGSGVKGLADQLADVYKRQALCDGKLFLPETGSRLTDVLVCDKMLERLLVDRNPVVHGFHDVRHTQGISDDRITQIVDHIVGEL